MRHFLVSGLVICTFLGCAGGVIAPTSEVLDVKLRRFEVLAASFNSMDTEVIVEVNVITDGFGFKKRPSSITN